VERLPLAIIVAQRGSYSGHDRGMYFSPLILAEAFLAACWKFTVRYFSMTESMGNASVALGPNCSSAQIFMSVSETRCARLNIGMAPGGGVGSVLGRVFTMSGTTFSAGAPTRARATAAAA